MVEAEVVFPVPGERSATGLALRPKDKRLSSWLAKTGRFFCEVIKQPTRRHDPAGWPRCGEVFEVSRYDIVRLRRLGTLQKDIIVRINARSYAVAWPNPDRILTDIPKSTCDRRFTTLKAGAVDNFLVLRKNVCANAQLK